MKRAIILLAMALACIQAYAYNVTGRVVDDKDKQPLPGVSIKVCLGTQDSAFLYTATNQEGRRKICCKEYSQQRQCLCHTVMRELFPRHYRIKRQQQVGGFR